MPQHRQLAAILFTDIVGYTALMQENEKKAVALIKHYNSSLNRLVSLHGGKVLNYYGDGSLCTFPSATEAINCAMELQKELQSDPTVPLRIGLHIGEIFFEEEKALGDGVNIASRIQSLGQENTILFSKEIHDKIRNHPEFKAVSLGLFDFKNVDEAIEVFALSNEGLVVPKKDQMSGKLKSDLSKRNNSFRKISIVVGSFLILLIAGVFLYLKDIRHPNYAVEKSVAVLPFVNMSNDPQQDYFADGMMDEILNHLYKIGGLKVTSRTSSLTYKGSKKTSVEIATELGVGSLLEGSVQKDGDHIRIIAQLINGKTDDHLWADTYVREFKDIFSIQSDIAQQIALALKIKIDPSVKERIESRPTENTEAYNLYLRAQKSSNPEEYRLFLETAIALDSSFSDAYVALAYYWIYSGSADGHYNTQEVIENAEPLLQKALKLNPDLARAHQGLATLYLWYKRDFEKVGYEYKKVGELDPSNPDPLNDFVFYLLAVGKFPDALKVSLRAFEKDTSDARYFVALALSSYFSGNSKLALQLLSRENLLRSDVYYWQNYIRICVYEGEYKKAILAFETNRSIFGFEKLSTNFLMGHIAVAYYKTEHKDSSEKFLNILKAESAKTPVGSPSYYIAAIYTAMGKNDLAIQWLQKSFKDREVEMYWLKIEPMLNSLHNDPRFKEILAKIGFK